MYFPWNFILSSVFAWLILEYLSSSSTSQSSAQSSASINEQSAGGQIVPASVNDVVQVKDLKYFYKKAANIDLAAPKDL